MNTPKKNSQTYLIIYSDNQAKKVLENYLKISQSLEMTEILNDCLSVIAKYSFVEHQTYPRPHHPISNKRKDRFFTLLSIIISLRTTLEIEQRVTSILTNSYNDVEVFLSEKPESLLEIIKPAGMAKQKLQTIYNASEKLKNICNFNWEIIDNFELLYLRDQLLSINGMGNKAVDCFLLLGCDRIVFPIDTNVFNYAKNLEVFVNQNLNFTKAKDCIVVKKYFENILPPDVQLYQIIHTLLLLKSKYRV